MIATSGLSVLDSCNFTKIINIYFSMGFEMTIKSLLNVGEDQAVALSAPGRPSLSYQGLRAHIEAIGSQLAGKGLTSGDRVAICLLYTSPSPRDS